MENIYDLTLSELTEYMQEIGEAPYRAEQVYKWIYGGAKSFEDMTNIPKSLREGLSEKFGFYLPTIEKKLVSRDGTTKYLFRLHDNNLIESVVMRYKHGNSICVSTQVGCRMGCGFCASTQNGLERNLTPGEIMGELLAAGEDIGERISNIVLMGSGEPLDNYQNVMAFIRNAINPKGLKISARNITLSTCGICDKIYALADEGLPITLSVSLHAPNDEIRKGLMPIARSVSMESLFSACRHYIEKTGRRVTFEYALIKGVNDSHDHARELGEKLSGMLCHVNLIPVNPVEGRAFTRADVESVNKFSDILKRMGINTTIRRVLGDDINAACGQLRNSYLTPREGGA